MPSSHALNAFCFNKLFLVSNLVVRNLKIKYQRSMFGLLWTLLMPASMAVAYFLIFNVVMRIQIPNYLIYIFSGIIPWAFFSQTIIESTESIVWNTSLITKIPIPVQIFSFISTITNFITMILGLPVLLALAAFYQVPFGTHFLLLPLYFIALFICTYCFGFLFSITFVFFRDMRHLIGVVMQFWFLGTPVIYDEQMLPAKLRWLIHLNPVGDIFCGLHAILAKGTWPSSLSLCCSAAWVMVAFVTIVIFTKKYAKGVVEYI